MLSRRKVLAAAALGGISVLTRRLLLTGQVGASAGGVIPPSTTVFKGLFNAAATSAYDYTIGPFSSTDGGLTYTPGTAATLLPGSGWESVYVKDPSVIWNGTQYVCYYTGWNNSNFQIGRATASAIDGAWTKYGSNPIIGVPNDGSYRQSGGIFPTARYDSTLARPYQLWITGSNAGVFTVGFLDSTDGISFTDYGRVLNLGAGGQFDDTGLHLGSVIKSGSTYYVYYSGWNSDTFRHSSYATCTNPAGTYTKLGAAMAGFTGLISAGAWNWRSNMVRAVTARGSEYRVFIDLWNPGAATGPPTDTEEGCAIVTSSSLTSFPVPSSLMFALNGGNWYANSAENPTGLFVA